MSHTIVAFGSNGLSRIQPSNDLQPFAIYAEGNFAAINTSLDLKAPLAHPVFTGSVTAGSFIGDGSGLTNLPSSGLTIGGSNGDIQFNSSGALGGSSDLAWNGTTLTVTGTVATSAVHSAGTLALSSDTSTIDAGLSNLISVAQIQGAGEFPATIDMSQITISDFSANLSIDWGNRFLCDTSANTSIDWGNYHLLNSAATLVLDWGNNQLANGAGNVALDWSNNQMFDGSQVSSVDWQARQLYDGSGLGSVLWANRQLMDDGGNLSVNWTGRQLIDADTDVIFDWNDNAATFSVAVTAPSFSGDGSAITSINASNIGSGTIANSHTTATSNNTINTIVSRNAIGAFSAGTITATFSGDGSLITNLNAASVTGTFLGGQVIANTGGASIVPLKILANSGQSGNLFQIRNSADSATIVQIDASGNLTLNNASITATNACTAGGFSQKSTAQVTWTQSTNPFDTLDTGLGRSSAGVVKVTNGGAGAGSLTAATITATTGFSGVGSSITSLTAANLTGSHTLPDSTLSTNVPLLNAANTFTANQTVTGSAALSKRITTGVVTVTAVSNVFTIDASLGNEFTATLAATNSFAVPSNAVDGQEIKVRIKQDGTGSRTITWSSSTGGFRFPSGATPVLSTGANKTDYIKFVYNGTDSKWDLLGMVGNF